VPKIHFKESTDRWCFEVKLEYSPMDLGESNFKNIVDMVSAKIRLNVQSDDDYESEGKNE
jgi:hypothetical protein